MRPTDYTGCPDGMEKSLRLWVEHGIPPGSALMAVLQNDLSGAVMRCGSHMWLDVAATIRWLHSCAPAQCWGSPERCHNWKVLKQGERDDT